MRDRVGVRELRQNLSVYLRRVKSGETLEVTERNRTVALLAPLPGMDSPLARLAAEGRVVRLASLAAAELPEPRQRSSRRSADAIDEQRRERP